MTGENRAAAALISVGMILSTPASAPRPEILPTEVAPLPAPDAPDRSFPPLVRQSLVQAGEEVIDYWAARGVTTTLGNFVLLEGAATTPNYCGKTVTEEDGKAYVPKPVISSGDNVTPHYCPTGDKIIINPMGVQIGLSEGLPPGSEEAAVLAEVIMRHESAHHAQYQLGLYKTLSYQAVEEQAECFAGHMTALSAPEDYRQIIEFYHNRTNGEELADHFTKGFNDVAGGGQACENYQ